MVTQRGEGGEGIVPIGSWGGDAGKGGGREEGIVTLQSWAGLCEKRGGETLTKGVE